MQSVLEDCIEKILGKKHHVIASGRTDSGTHALGQVASVKGSFPMEDEKVMLALNSLLPEDIAVKSAQTVPMDFHANKNALWKTYRYTIFNSRVRSPLMARTAWRVPVKLNVRAMRKACGYFLGEHDFKSFMGPRSTIKTTVRNIIRMSVKKEGETITVEITANGFLKQMVRNIVGTLVETGRGMIEPADIEKIIESKNRKNAGPTAPAHGLCLVEVIYP